MPSEQDEIADSINKPMLILAGVLVVVGFCLTLLFVTMPIGLPMMAAGGIWMAVLYGAASHHAHHS